MPRSHRAIRPDVDTSLGHQVSYEGSNVATADLVANPIISAESLRSWVQQKVDEPYSAAKIENTISALRETGRFSPVEVDVKLDHGGLRLFALAGESTAIQSKKS